LLAASVAETVPLASAPVDCLPEHYPYKGLVTKIVVLAPVDLGSGLSSQLPRMVVEALTGSENFLVATRIGLHKKKTVYQKETGDSGDSGYSIVD
jgi:hypothetical protein